MRAALLAFVLSAASGLGAATPFSFPRATPESQGIDSAAVLQFVEEAERRIDALHSVMIVRHGNVVTEGWWSPYAASEPHMMFSLSKSFTSTAVGLAVAEGKLNVDDPVLGFFPDEAPAQPSANLKAMRVRDLLTMSTGHHEEDLREFPYNGDANVVFRFLSLPVAHKPGTFFVYNTPASYTLSAIVQKVTGQPVLEYLKPRLFEPLGVVDPTWDASKQGVSMGGFGLSVRTEDIARFGQLYLAKGEWQGRPLLPATWVEAATMRQMSNGSSPASDWEQGYGYQFWRSRHGFYRGDGAHGQFCLILPQHDTVIAITSGTRDMASVMNLVWDRLVPALKNSPLSANAEAHRALSAKLAALTLPAVAQTATTAVERTIAGKRFVFESNPQSIEAVTFAGSTGTESSLQLRVGGTDARVVAAPGTWSTGTLPIGGTQAPIAASGGWTGEDTYTLKVVRYRTPFVATYRLKFGADTLTLTTEQNVGPADQKVTQIVGRAQPSTSSQD